MSSSSRAPFIHAMGCEFTIFSYALFRQVWRFVALAGRNLKVAQFFPSGVVGRVSNWMEGNVTASHFKAKARAYLE